MAGWKKLSQTVKRIGYRTLVFKNYQLPDGDEREFTTYSSIGKQDVAIIALTPDNQVVIARQFRPGPEMIMDELPGGAVEEGEELEAAVRRELSEETGYQTAELEYLGPARRDAYSNATTHYFLGRNCRKTSQQQLDHGEFVEVILISANQLLDNAKKGMMTDAPAVLLAYEQLQQLAT